jgi:hypothetical protein
MSGSAAFFECNRYRLLRLGRLAKFLKGPVISAPPPIFSSGSEVQTKSDRNPKPRSHHTYTPVFPTSS